MLHAPHATENTHHKPTLVSFLVSNSLKSWCGKYISDSQWNGVKRLTNAKEGKYELKLTLFGKGRFYAGTNQEFGEPLAGHT